MGSTGFIAPLVPSFKGVRSYHCAVQMSATTTSVTSRSAPARLREVLAEDKLLLMPCCYDGLSARLIERAGFPVTFMSGYSVAGSFGLPDTGLLTAAEMRDALMRITAATKLPVMADADTGFGNAMNVKRTLAMYFAAGAAGILIEDQQSPKRCGHTRGKSVVSFDEAVTRVRAACDARDEWAQGDDQPVILARTDAGRFDFNDAIDRCRAFLAAGADGTFLEAPLSVEQMQRYCDEVPGWKLVNCLEMGETPILKPKELHAMGFKIAAYPLTMLSSAVRAQEEILARIARGEKCEDLLKSFRGDGGLCDVVGFNSYYAEEERYANN